MKAYIVQEKPYEPEYGQYPILVFAKTARDAKKLGWPYLDPQENDSWIKTTAKRFKNADKYLDQYSAPKVFYWNSNTRKEDEILRALGWYSDGDTSCNECGLYEMDGLYPVCCECDFCSECGHHKDCQIDLSEVPQ